MSGDGELSGQDKARLREAKEDRALLFRTEGKGYKQIAQALGYSDASGAAKAVKRALARRPADDVEQARQVEVDRLDALICVLWPKATQGQLFTIDRVLAIMQRRAELLGLDVPKTINVKHTLLEEAKQIAEQYGITEAEAVAIAQEVIRDARAQF